MLTRTDADEKHAARLGFHGGIDESRVDPIGVDKNEKVTLAEPLVYVRRCAGEGCSLFFTDDSPTQSRRWCNAAVCGREVRVERRRGLLR